MANKLKGKKFMNEFGRECQIISATSKWVKFTDNGGFCSQITSIFNDKVRDKKYTIIENTVQD